MRTSGAVQLRDLARELASQGHDVTVLLPSSTPKQVWALEEIEGYSVLRLNAPRTKDIGYLRRTIAEFLMPFSMMRSLDQSPLRSVRWDGVVWYAPSIFHGPLAKALKTRSRCRGYLIVRDIFPEWALDMRLIGPGLPYALLKLVAHYQYSVADFIGVQTSGNLSYFAKWSARGRQIEVLQNWLAPAPIRTCSIRLADTRIAGRKIFVYAGNMGVAQGMDILLDLAASWQDRRDVGFLFVGRGSEAKRLAERSMRLGLSNVLFFDEIDPDEIPGLYAQCHVGLLALDVRHRSHNIPGKFLTYMQSGLPVLANVNPGNDLAALIREENVGRVTESNSVEALQSLAADLLTEIDNDESISRRCRSMFEQRFSAAAAAHQIVAALSTEVATTLQPAQ